LERGAYTSHWPSNHGPVMHDLEGRVMDDHDTKDREKGVYLVIDNEPAEPETRYRRRAIRLMAVIHLFLGSLAVTVDCLVMLKVLAGDVVGLGLCCGLIFTATGTLGLTSLQRTSTCKITSFLVLSIISTVFGGFLCLLSMFMFGSYRHGHDGGVVAPGVLMLVGLAELVLGIVSSAYACLACCSCCGGEGRAGAGNKVVYLASPGTEEGPRVVRVNLRDGGEVPLVADAGQDGKFHRFK